MAESNNYSDPFLAEAEAEPQNVLATWIRACIIFLIYALLTSVNCGIVAYESVVPDTYRTLMNKVVALMSAYNIVFAHVMLVGAMPRNFHLSPGDPFCSLHLFAFVLLLLQVFLVHNEFAALLFVYARRPGFVELVNERVATSYIVAANLVVGTVLSVSICIISGADYTVYHACMGRKANMEFLHPENIISVLASVTGVNHFLASWKAVKQFRKIQTQEDEAAAENNGDIELHEMGISRDHRNRDNNRNVSGNVNESSEKKKSFHFLQTCIVDYSSSVVLIGVVSVLGPVVGVVSSYSSNRLWFGLCGALRMLLIYVFILFLPLSIYMRKKHLREILAREIKSRWT